MPKNNSTIPQHTLQPANSRQRRSFPDLQDEIGKLEADILLQLDHWITFYGQDGWIKCSSRDIKEASFPAYSQRTIDAALNSLATDNYIINKPGTDKTPQITLNLYGLNTLESIIVATSANPADMSAKTAEECAKLADLCANSAEPPQDLRSMTIYIYKSIRLKNRKLFEREQEENDPPDPPNPPDSGSYFEPTQSDSLSFELFATTLANTCSLDYALNRRKVCEAAQELWDAGYRSHEDLADVRAYWYKHDWRGKDNNSPPHLSQVGEVIKKALDHEDTAQRRKLREMNIDPDSPDASRYRYISGEYADAIDH